MNGSASATSAAGKHVFLEKPMTATLADADAIVDRARRSDRVLLVGFQERHNLALVEMRRAMQEGVLGDVLFIRGTGRIPRKRLEKGWLFNTAQGGRYEDTFAAIGRLTGGALVEIEACFSLPDGTAFDSRIEVVGTRGMAYYDVGCQPLLISSEMGFSFADRRVTGTAVPDLVHNSIRTGRPVEL